MTAVLLAAGHGRTPAGGWDPGTTWTPAKGKPAIVEHDRNEAVLFAATDRFDARGFRDYGVEQGATRNSNDKLDGNWAAFRQLVSSTAAVRIAVEIHHDIHGARRGGFAIIPKKVGYDASNEWAAADAITAAYKALGLPVLTSYADRRGLGLLNRPKFPTLIWECDRIGDDNETEKCGQAIADGILAYLGWSGPAAPSKLPVLRRGSTGPDVERLQRLLRLAPNGAFGSATETAVLALQRRHGLVADGIVGPKTWAALGVVS